MNGLKINNLNLSDMDLQNPEVHRIVEQSHEDRITAVEGLLNRIWWGVLVACGGIVVNLAYTILKGK